MALGGGAGAASAAPAWHLDALTNTTAAPGSTITYYMQLRNVGDAPADLGSSPLRLSGTLPPGITILSGPAFGWDCSTLVPGAQDFTCTNNSDTIQPGTNQGSVRYFQLRATVGAGASGELTATFGVAGGDSSNPSTTTMTTMTATNAAPVFGISAFDGEVTDRNGDPFTQAGGHPFAATTSFDINTFRHPEGLKGDLTPVEALRNVVVDLPPGFVGDPTGSAKCTQSQLANAIFINALPLCPPASQIGTVLVRLNGFTGSVVAGPIPLFNMVPPPDAPARFGFNVAGTVVTLDASVRSATDYGLTVTARYTPEGAAIAGTSLTIWGNPASSVHDRDRACPGEAAPFEGGPTCRSGTEETAFLRNPTSCPDPGVGIPTTLRADSWVRPGVIKQASFITHLPIGYPFPRALWGDEIGPTGCADVPFAPRLKATPSTPRAAEPSGFAFDLSLPQTENPDAIGTSDLRKSVVTLPLGVHFSASATAGLEGCTPAQIGLDNANDPSCPERSRIGTVKIDTPVLDDPVEGTVYLAGPRNNPFNTLIALYLVAKAPGVMIKLPGKVESDLFTGQLTATFDNNPQLPFSNLHLQFKGGPQAPIVNPSACGTYYVHSELTSWSGKVVTSDEPFEITQSASGAPCAGTKFDPGFSAGTERNSGGESSTFNLRLTRQDDDEELRNLTVRMPRGLTGRIALADLCSDKDANAGTCGEASRIGSVTTGAGAGPNPFYITNGRAYITGPYKKAPFGLSIVVPAVAGPFDLGNVIVRAAIFVDKHTAELRIDSEPLPLLLEGITLGVRDVRVAVDKPGFFLNPTSCAEKQIVATIGSASGQTVTRTDRFQASECRSLPVKPKMTLTVGGPGHTGRNASPPFIATLTQTPGQANLRSVEVTLPKVLNSHLPAVERACKTADYDAGRCRSLIGTAVARTPLLKDALRGNAYFVRRTGARLPDIVVALRGQVDFDLVGRIQIPRDNSLKTMFDTVPDVPITSFTLSLIAGRNGPVGTTTNLCSRRGRNAKAAIDFVGQNGRVLQRQQRLVIRGCNTRGGRRARGARGNQRGR